MARRATKLGNEEINAAALKCVQGCLLAGDEILFQSGFNWDKSVIVLTRQAIIVGHESNEVVEIYPYEGYEASQKGRTLVVSSRYGSDRREESSYSMGSDDVVRKLRGHIYRLRREWRSELEKAKAEGKDLAGYGMRQSQETSPSADEDGEKLSIGKRVKFWEEQDKINQALIPRFIDQSKLLTKHIKEHDNLPQVAGNAISQALSGAREEQRQQYEAALDATKTELAEQARNSITQATDQLQADLSAHKSELSEHTQAAVQKALDDMRTALADAKVELSEHTQASLTQATEQLQAGLTTHTATLSEQAQSGLDQALMTLREESRKARNLLIGIASGACAIAIAAIILAVLT